MKQCTVCGISKPFTEFYKNHRCSDGHLGHCIPCNKEKDKLPQNRYSRFRAQNRRYQIEFTLTLEEFKELLHKGCHYCGGTLLDNHGANLDRIDRLKGYIPGNVLPCCWLCNAARGVIFNVREMEQIGAMFKSFQAERARLGEPPLIGPQKFSKPENRTRKYIRPLGYDRPAKKEAV